MHLALTSDSDGCVITPLTDDGVLSAPPTPVPDTGLAAHLEERVFAPLGMVDTAFSVPESKRHRFTDCYGGQPHEIYDAIDGQWSIEPA